MAFERLEKYIDELPDYDIPACDCIIYKDHEKVFRHSAGFRDSEKTQAVAENDLYWCFSSSKVITCTAAMQLIEQNKISLNDEVEKYLPSFKNMTVKTENGVEPCRNKLTIWNLFTMTGGINFGIDSALQFLRNVGMPEDTTTLQAVNRIAQEPLCFEPGTHFRYGFEHDVLGAVIEMVSGMGFDEYLKKNIFEPLGITDMYFCDSAPRERISQFYIVKNGKLVPDTQAARDYLACFKHYHSGGGGIITSVEDYGKFVDAMANNGVSAEGRRIISEDSIKLMSSNQLNEDLLKDYYKGPGNLGYGYGLGVRTLLSQKAENNISKSSLGEFGWGGADGTYALIDREKKIGIFYAQHVLGGTFNFDYQNHPHNMIRDITFDEISGNF